PDEKTLSRVIGREVVAVTARTGRGLSELRAAVDRALRSERRSDWVWTPSPALRADLDAVKAALPPAWRAPARVGADLPGSDDAIALWALTCIEQGDEADELTGVPAELRA